MNSKFFRTPLVGLLLALPASVLATDIYFTAYDEADNEFEFGSDSPTGFSVISPPSDIDWTRGAMAAETSSSNYDLFYFKENSGSELYFFQFVAARSGFIERTVPVNLTNRPSDLDVTSFSVAADRTGLYYYGRSRTNSELLYRAPGLNTTSGGFAFDFSEATEVRLAGVPSDVDWTGWAVATYANGDTRLLLRKKGSIRTVYEGFLNASDGDIDFDDSLVAIEAAPFGVDSSDFMAVVDDRGVYQLIYPTQDVADVFPTATLETSDKWYESQWFGYFNSTFFPWIYHETLGWFWSAGEEDDLYLFRESTNQWLYTADDLYPWAADLVTGEWEQL